MRIVDAAYGDGINKVDMSRYQRSERVVATIFRVMSQQNAVIL